MEARHVTVTRRIMSRGRGKVRRPCAPLCGGRNVPHARDRDREAVHVRWAERGGAGGQPCGYRPAKARLRE